MRSPTNSYWKLPLWSRRLLGALCLRNGVDAGIGLPVSCVTDRLRAAHTTPMPVSRVTTAVLHLLCAMVIILVTIFACLGASHCTAPYRTCSIVHANVIS